MVEVSLTVGKLDASLALLLTKDHHLIEFPTILLPDGISTGSIVKIECDRDLKEEERENEQFNNLQEEIYETFGKHEPEKPSLKVVNVTQTSCVLEWEPLQLGTAELKSMTLYKNGSKLGQIKNPKLKKNIKLSGLPVDTTYKFQLKMDTTAGIYHSNTIELKTHKMTDLSGISICVGSIDFDKETQFTLNDIYDLIKNIGAKPINRKVKIDTTQFICTDPSGVECEKAKSMNIPVVRPEWLKACELERRIVGVNKFYINSETPIWKEKDFWEVPELPEAANAEELKGQPEGPEEPEEPKEELKEETKEPEQPKQEPKQEPKEEPKQEPKEEPKQEPKEEPKEEPKQESKEEPKELKKPKGPEELKEAVENTEEKLDKSITEEEIKPNESISAGPIEEVAAVTASEPVLHPTEATPENSTLDPVELTTSALSGPVDESKETLPTPTESRADSVPEELNEEPEMLKGIVKEANDDENSPKSASPEPAQFKHGKKNNTKKHNKKKRRK
ncbi:hypothetical protein FOA43_000648 [Brettanomyces nanus]|uniref:Chitin biosynthesis protein CHS5 n=1 Tax=Eeniella nana TaxID=13502 RepID=A0A875RXH3_EENNA|nr:uncharacterized protein FOA43_000648 [Brettanomyces nanus]QPG73338.1 hypothetical protein FOA43_000648 [Brettanomyces nanus]